MTAGERTFAVVEDYTRYYKGVDDQIPVTIEAGGTTQRDYYFLPDKVWADIDYRTDYGQALYVTGQTEYLGNWQEAKKLGYRDSTNTWILRDRLPIGAECKIVRGDWTDDEWISTDGVDWQQGPNQVIEATGGSYPGGRLETTPQF